MEDTFAKSHRSKTLLVAAFLFFAVGAMDVVGAVVYHQRLLYGAAVLFATAAVMLLVSLRRK
jgi:hypothetical protein